MSFCFFFLQRDPSNFNFNILIIIPNVPNAYNVV